MAKYQNTGCKDIKGKPGKSCNIHIGTLMREDKGWLRRNIDTKKANVIIKMIKTKVWMKNRGMQGSGSV